METVLTDKRRRLFWKKVEKNGKCWLWTASLPPSKVPQFWNGFQLMPARDFACLLENRMPFRGTGKPYPTCGKPMCVRPAHWASLGLTPFDAFVKKMPGKGCWIWMGRMSGSYGRFQDEMAHRISYQRKYGPLADGVLVRQLCNVKLCVRPDHLKTGYWKDNAADNGKEMKRRNALRTSANAT